MDAAAQALNASEFTVNLAVEKVDFGKKQGSKKREMTHSPMTISRNITPNR